MHSGSYSNNSFKKVLFSFSRLYLITSPVVRDESLKFKEEGVRDILKDVFLPWYNALRHFLYEWKCLTIVKSVIDKIREMSDIDIEKLLSKDENESPLTVIDDVRIELEDIHIVYRAEKQTRFLTTAEKRVW